MSIKHSKYKNTGILFELLTRQVVSDTLNGNKNSTALRIIERFFGKSTELGKEYMLYRSFFNGKQLSEHRALDYINIITEKRKTLDTKKLTNEKYELVKYIKEHYDLKEFLSGRVPAYKVYASIYKTFESNMANLYSTDIEDITESRYTLVEYLTGEIKNKSSKAQSEADTILREQEEDLRLLSYRILLEKFNEKYKDLNSDQKTLLKEYINNFSNKKYMLELLQSEANRLNSSVSRKLKNVTNPVIVIKLKEIIHQLNEFKSLNSIKNHHFTQIMIGYELDKQLDAFQTHHG